MKIQDIVNQIRVVFPKHSGLLSDSFSVASIVASGGVATITTNTTVGLSGNESVTIANVAFENPIASVTQDGLIFTFTTSQDHDLTQGWVDHETVTFIEFTDTAWNDSFKLISVPNRRTFSVQSVNTIPTLTGAERLLEVRSDGVNGRFQPTPLTLTTFSVSGTFLDGDYVNGSVSGTVRVAGAVDVATALEVYTDQKTDDMWAFVVPKDIEISKDRSSLSDATATKPTGNDMRLRMLDGFQIHAFQKSTNTTSGIKALDILKNDFLGPLTKALFGAIFPTGLDGSGDFRAVLTGAGVSHYDKALLVYGYDFEVAMDLTDGDAVTQGDTRAFRDIDYTQNIGTEEMTVGINLDEEPLP